MIGLKHSDGQSIFENQNIQFRNGARCAPYLMEAAWMELCEIRSFVAPIIPDSATLHPDYSFKSILFRSTCETSLIAPLAADVVMAA